MDGNRPCAGAGSYLGEAQPGVEAGSRLRFAHSLVKPSASGRRCHMAISTSSTLVLSLRTALLALLLLFACPLFAKRKDDVIVMKNGDKFTGEIKNLQYGELVFKSSYMKDSVHLDWKEV